MKLFLHYIRQKRRAFLVTDYLQMFLFENVTLMVVVNVVSFGVFARIYAVVYRITSNAYYTIVSGRKE